MIHIMQHECVHFIFHVWPIVSLLIVYISPLILVSSLSVNSSQCWCFLLCIPDYKFISYLILSYRICDSITTERNAKDETRSQEDSHQRREDVVRAVLPNQTATSCLRGRWSRPRTNDSALIARFIGPTWSPSGADRNQVGPMYFAIWVV